jgi:hypothetical protein
MIRTPAKKSEKDLVRLIAYKNNGNSKSDRTTPPPGRTPPLSGFGGGEGEEETGSRWQIIAGGGDNTQN